MPERWGIKIKDAENKINLHSDYSSMVYYDEMIQNTAAVRAVYTGDNYVPISEAQKTTFYDMGWVVQYKLTNINTEFLLPFYLPAFSGQQIGILDVIRKDSRTWLVNLIYSGNELDRPRVYAFAPLNAIPLPSMQGRWGLNVFDENNRLVFTDNKRPLRVDDVVIIKHTDSIKTGAKGTCGNSKTCHINFTSDQTDTYTGTAINTDTKLYHIVPSAYGGLAYKNSGSGKGDCGVAELGRYEYAWIYQSWASFRGTVGHIWGNSTHKVDWLSDFAGAYHKYDEGSCGLSGILGAILGVGLAFFTAGASLVFLVGGALTGFALSGVNSVPSLKAYAADETIDTNTASNLIITDARYYNIDINSYRPPPPPIPPPPPPPVPLVYQFDNDSNNAPYLIYWQLIRFDPIDGAIEQTGELALRAVYPATPTTPRDPDAVRLQNISASTTKVTFEGRIYHRGNFKGSYTVDSTGYVGDTNQIAVIGNSLFEYYELAVEITENVGPDPLYYFHLQDSNEWEIRRQSSLATGEFESNFGTLEIAVNYDPTVEEYPGSTARFTVENVSADATSVTVGAYTYYRGNFVFESNVSGFNIYSNLVNYNAKRYALAFSAA